MQRSLWLCLVLCVPSQAGEWVIPWVANKTGEWSSELVLNNLGAADVEASVTAVRADGSSETKTLVLRARSQYASLAAALFPTLGSGSGYAVFISSTSDTLGAAARVASLNTASGFSPSMGEAVSTSHSAPRLVFQTLPADGFSAPAILHLGSGNHSITFHAYTAAGAFPTSFSVTLPPRTPYANVVTSMFPGLAEGAFLVAESDAPLLGANFSFNALLEPSLINAQPDPNHDSSDLVPLLMGLDTSALLSAAYSEALSQTKQPSASTTKRICPTVSYELDHVGADPLLRVVLDYGAGCTSTSGGHHSGIISLSIQRIGGANGDWLHSAFNFEQFVSTYRGSAVSIDGDVALEGAALSKNFVLTADLDFHSSPPLFSDSSDMSLVAQLYANLASAMPTIYGTFTIAIQTPYTYTIQASIPASDPLVYDYAACNWPIDGRIDFTLDKSGQTVRGWIDFGTGNCDTALLHAFGREEIIDLNSIN